MRERGQGLIAIDTETEISYQKLYLEKKVVYYNQNRETLYNESQETPPISSLREIEKCIWSSSKSWRQSTNYQVPITDF